MLTEEQRTSVEILAVSVDSHEKSAELIAALGEDGKPFEITLLEDGDHRVIDRYGLLNPSIRRSIPHPATFVIDREGKVTWRFVDVDYSKRPTNQEIQEALAAAEGT